MNQRLFLVLS